MKCVILAGGVGTRLWPMSRQQSPKQFAALASDQAMIVDVYNRLRKRFSADNIFVSTSPAFDAQIQQLLPELNKDRLFVEPEKRDTGPAMGYVCALLELQFPDEPVVFIPSDHVIADDERFLDCLAVGESLIRETGKLIDIGVEATFPSTMLGYTKIGAKVEERQGVQVFEFAGHTEKPSRDVAERYFSEGVYLWHANYYMWTPRLFMQAFERYAPELAGGLRQLQRAFEAESAEEMITAYSTLPKISLDYAVTEKMATEDVLILKGEFGWSDIGAWNTLHDQLAEGDENIVKGPGVQIRATRSLVYGHPEKFTAVVGLSDVVIVDTDDALLVCHKDHAQQVKDVVNHLRELNQTNLL